MCLYLNECSLKSYTNVPYFQCRLIYISGCSSSSYPSLLKAEFLYHVYLYIAVVCVSVHVCLPVSLLPHTQAFLTQEDLDLSLSVSTKTLDILIMSLSMLVQLWCVVVSLWRLAGGSSTGMLSTQC